MKVLLSARGITKRFGGLAAVSGLNLDVREGELLGLIGPNGAGKTTVFNLLTGVYPPTEGHVEFDGRRLRRMRPYQAAHLGIARTFQNIRLFRRLSALDNVRVAAHVRTTAGFWSCLLRTAHAMRNDAVLTEKARALLGALDLTSVAAAPAGDLPYGVQRRLEIARALATDAKLLLLDEPAAGMNPAEKQELMELIHAIRRDFSVTVLLIEHDMRVVMGICERIYVLDYGQVIAEGRPERIRSDPRVIAAYLGEESEPC
ncbi:MAG TPA: ABC transporter ATP-binding protein [Chthonomonadales bacterium]|nr:ABC transporter ATP-binding protein [Chthonomonadales bacterium]